MKEEEERSGNGNEGLKSGEGGQAWNIQMSKTADICILSSISLFHRQQSSIHKCIEQSEHLRNLAMRRCLRRW